MSELYGIPLPGLLRAIRSLKTKSVSIAAIVGVALNLSAGVAAAQEDWPTPYVALFDCNTSGAFVGTVGEKNLLDSASCFILRDILADSSSLQVFLFSIGFADTGSTNMSFLGGSFSLPDSGVPSDENYQFIISSEITGNAGSYALTVSLQDRATYAHVGDGTANFASATAADVGTACLSAVNQILPLTTKVRDYQKSLKAANPLLVINPRFDLAPASQKLAAGGSTDMIITVTDCDATPIAGRELTLGSTCGSFASSSVMTAQDGKATVSFTAGESEGYAVLTATLQDAATVAGDTSTFSGQATLVIGEAAAADLWVLNFDIRRSWTGYNDKVTQKTDGTEWSQKNTFWTQRALGQIFATPNGSDNREFFFNDTTMSVSGLYRWHQFAKITYTDLTADACPQTSFEMSGASQTYTAGADPDTYGEASFEYTSDHSSDLFDVEIPFTQASYYAYDWRTSGRWDNGQCVTSSSNQSMRLKWISTTGGMGAATLFGSSSDLSILPLYSGTVLLGYSIFIDRSSSGYLSDLTNYFMREQCVATLKPFATTTGVESARQPLEFSLSQNYPNPFNPSTAISYKLSALSSVTLKIYDVLGREVATLVNGRQSAGSHTVKFDASRLSSGVYFYKLVAEDNGSRGFVSTKKLVLIK